MKKSISKDKRKTKYYREKDTSRRGILRWILLAILIALFLAFFTGSKSLLRLYSLYQEKKSLEKQKEELIKESERIKDEIYKLDKKTKSRTKKIKNKKKIDGSNWKDHPAFVKK